MFVLDCASMQSLLSAKSERTKVLLLIVFYLSQLFGESQLQLLEDLFNMHTSEKSGTAKCQLNTALLWSLLKFYPAWASS